MGAANLPSCPQIKKKKKEGCFGCSYGANKCASGIINFKSILLEKRLNAALYLIPNPLPSFV